MKSSTVVLLGSLPFDTSALDRVVRDLGWEFEEASSIDQLQRLSATRKPLAILFEANGLGLSWLEALKSLRDIDSQACLIPCYRFSDAVNWPELAEAGAFHAVALPLDPSEIRQSLGYVWSAQFRRESRAVRATLELVA